MVTRSKGSVLVDPSSFQRSAGRSSGGTVSWQLAPAPHEGGALAAAGRALAGALQGARAGSGPPGTVAALRTADGRITAETSLPEPLGRHPLVTTILAEATAELTRLGQRPGLGRCVETTLVSNRLYEIEQQWTAAGRPGELRAYARVAFHGAVLSVRQLGSVHGRPHGARRPLCRLCAILLPALGIAVAGEQEPVRSTSPPPVDVPLPGGPDPAGTATIEWLLGTPFTPAGGLSAVTDGLLAAGPGSTALVLVTWHGPNRGPHRLAAANLDGTVCWSESPAPHTVSGVWSAVLTASGVPPHAPGPPPPLTTRPVRFDPAAPTCLDLARLAEIGVLTGGYADADAEARVEIRAELAPLVDALDVRPDSPRFAGLPADVATDLLALATPLPTPKAVATVLAADPARLNPPQRAWQADFARELADVFTGTLPPAPARRTGGVTATVAAGLADRVHRLAVAGESAVATVPRLPAYAGQVIGLPPDRLDVLREFDPTLADQATALGVYVDLTGRPDLTPYASVAVPADPDPELSIVEQRTRARAAFRDEHGGTPHLLALLATHDFHHVRLPDRPDEPVLALVPDLVAAAVRAITPVRPPPAVPPTRPPAPPVQPVVVSADPVRAVASVPVEHRHG